MQERKWLLATSNPKITYTVHYKNNWVIQDWKFYLYGRTMFFITARMTLHGIVQYLKSEWHVTVTEILEIT